MNLTTLQLTEHLLKTTKQLSCSVLEVIGERNKLRQDAESLEQLKRERNALKDALRYVAYERLDNLGTTVFEKLTEPRQRWIHDLLEGVCFPQAQVETVKVLGEEPIERETAEACDHDWKAEGADSKGNWISVCRKCGQIQE